MKQFSLVFLVISPLLAIFTTIIHELHNHVEWFNSLYPAIQTYLRFHQLSYVIGLILLAISVLKKMDQLLLYVISSSIFAQFVFYEFNIISLFSWSYTLLSLIFLCALSIYIKMFDSKNIFVPICIKHISLSIITFYSLVLLTYTILSVDFIEIYIFSYTLLQFGLFILFKSWYKSEFGLSTELFIQE